MFGHWSLFLILEEGTKNILGFIDDRGSVGVAVESFLVVRDKDTRIIGACLSLTWYITLTLCLQ